MQHEEVRYIIKLLESVDSIKDIIDEVDVKALRKAFLAPAP